MSQRSMNYPVREVRAYGQKASDPESGFFLTLVFRTGPFIFLASAFNYLVMFITIPGFQELWQGLISENKNSWIMNVFLSLLALEYVFFAIHSYRNVSKSKVDLFSPFILFVLWTAAGFLFIAWVATWYPKWGIEGYKKTEITQAWINTKVWIWLGIFFGSLTPGFYYGKKMIDEIADNPLEGVSYK